MFARKLLLAGAACAVIASLAWLVECLDNASLAGLLSDRVWEEQARRDRLNAESALLRQSTAVVEDALVDLIAGRLSLREVVAVVQGEEARRPPHLRRIIDAPPGRTEEERLARSVIRQVANKLGHRPERSAVLVRLRAELELLILVSGGPTGPAPPRCFKERRP